MMICIFVLPVCLAGQVEVDAQLRLNGAKRITVFQDELIRGRLILSLPFEEANARMNQTTMDEMDRLTDSLKNEWISQEYYIERKEELNSSLFELQSMPLHSNWTDSIKLIVTTSGRQLSTYEMEICHTSSQQSLRAGNRVFVDFWIRPSDESNPDNYQIQVQWKHWKSNTCRLTIKNENTPAQLFQSEVYLAKIAHHYFVCRDGMKLISIANQILELNPESIGGITYKADAHSFLAQNAEALELYQRALDIFDRDHADEYEQPGYLLSRIDLLSTTPK